MRDKRKKLQCLLKGTHLSDEAVLDPSRPYADVEDAISRASAPLIHVIGHRDHKFRRILYAIIGILVLALLHLVYVRSAVAPGVPLLRVYENEQRRTEQHIARINCNIQWSNNKRVLFPSEPSCAEIYDFLDSLPRHPLPEE